MLILYIARLEIFTDLYTHYKKTLTSLINYTLLYNTWPSGYTAQHPQPIGINKDSFFIRFHKICYLTYYRVSVCTLMVLNLEREENTILINYLNVLQFATIII